MDDPKISVAGIAFEGGKLFIARRIPGGDLGEKWEFPGGKAEKGEGDEEALIREFREEFNTGIRVGAFLASAVFEHRGIRRRLKAYRVAFTAHEFTLAEHTEWAWASFEEIEKLAFAESDRKLFPALKNYFNRNP